MIFVWPSLRHELLFREPLVELEELDDSELEADSGEKMVGEICIAFRVVFTGVYLHCFVIHYTTYYVNLNGWGRGLVGPKPRLSAGLGSRLRLEILQA
jgi:hypothetical protein